MRKPLKNDVALEMSSCQAEWTTPQSQNQLEQQRHLVIENCGVWKTAEALAIVGGALGVFGWISQFSSFQIVPKSFLIRYLGVFLPLLGSLCGCIAMSIYVYEKEQDDVEIEMTTAHSTTMYCVSFYFLIIGNVFLILGAITFGCCYDVKQPNMNVGVSPPLREGSFEWSGGGSSLSKQTQSKGVKHQKESCL